MTNSLFIKEYMNPASLVVIALATLIPIQLALFTD